MKTAQTGQSEELVRGSRVVQEAVQTSPRKGTARSSKEAMRNSRLNDPEEEDGIMNGKDRFNVAGTSVDTSLDDRQVSTFSQSIFLDEDDDCLHVEGIKFLKYTDESQLGDIMRLVGKDLSEPYSIFTYRYFLHHWPHLCLIAISEATGTPVGCVVCKIDDVESSEEEVPSCEEMPEAGNLGKTTVQRVGYLGMLAVDKNYRGTGIGKSLSIRAVERMRRSGCSSVVLEAEACNDVAIRLYERLGFIREERLTKYYLNWGDAYRLRLWFS